MSDRGGVQYEGKDRVREVIGVGVRVEVNE